MFPSPQPSPSRERGRLCRHYFVRMAYASGAGPQTALFQHYSASSITQTLTLPRYRRTSLRHPPPWSRFPRGCLKITPSLIAVILPEADRLFAVIPIRQHHHTARVLLSPAAAERNTVWMIENSVCTPWAKRCRARISSWSCSITGISM